MSLALTLSFAVLLGLAVLALLWSPWPVWSKGLLAVGVAAFSFFGHEAVRELGGLPSNEPLPPRFLMLAAAVDEPTSRGGGSIFMWVSEIVEGRSGLAPRAYRVKYTKNLHAQIDEGLKRTKDGVAQMGTAEVKLTGGRSGLGWLKPGADEQEVKIRDLPSPQLPEK
jgi:hypothetical protein